MGSCFSLSYGGAALAQAALRTDGLDRNHATPVGGVERALVVYHNHKDAHDLVVQNCRASLISKLLMPLIDRKEKPRFSAHRLHGAGSRRRPFPSGWLGK